MAYFFFQAAVVSILLYGCTTWTLTKRLEKKLDGNYTRMLWAILNKSWRQHLTRHQLYGHLPPITKIIQVRRTRHPGHCWRSRNELISDGLLWTPTYGREKQDDQLEHTYSSYVRTQDVALKTCQRWWTIGRSGERGSGISVLAAQHDDDDGILIFVGYLMLKPFLLEGQRWYNWTHSWWNKEDYTFSKVIRSKVNIIVRTDFELAYCAIAVQHVSDYSMCNSFLNFSPSVIKIIVSIKR